VEVLTTAYKHLWRTHCLNCI